MRILKRKTTQIRCNLICHLPPEIRTKRIQLVALRRQKKKRTNRRLGKVIDAASMNVLIVDDYKTMLRIIRNLLHEVGFRNIDEASDGASALENLKSKQYDLVLSDWNMEPMTGLELLKRVRSDASLAQIPFIMVTAEAKTENVVAAKKAGVNNYIVKPFNAATLRSKLTSVIGEF